MKSYAILKLVSEEPSVGLIGRARFHLNRDDTASVTSGNRLTPAQREFVLDVQGQATSIKDALQTYRHPDSDVRAMARQEGDEYRLSSSDLQWLARLPRDPAQITYDDAVTLATMARKLSSMTNPSDARLVDAVWSPVREIHDANRARVELHNSQAVASLPTPSTVVSALADAVSQENPDLCPEEAYARAQRLLGDTLDARTRKREAAVARAQKVIENVQTAKARRIATTRPQ